MTNVTGLDKDTYKVNVVCLNCGYAGTKEIKRGDPVPRASTCPNCGCAELNKRAATYDDISMATAQAAEQFAVAYVAKVGVSKESMIDAISTLRGILIETATELASWQARAEQAEARIERIRTPKVYEGPYYTLAEHPERCPECDNKTWISYGAKGMCCHVCMLICELDHAESTASNWKKDAEDKDVLIAELTAEVRSLKSAGTSMATILYNLCQDPSLAVHNVSVMRKRQEEWDALALVGQGSPGAVRETKDGVLPRSTDLEREDGHDVHQG